MYQIIAGNALITKMNYEAERAMNQKRLRMEGEPGHGVVQGNGLPLNYIDNGHQIPYQPYAGAYNTHYPPPDAFSPYGPPPPGGYAPQNLSYAPPAHQNYPHHQSFPPQQPPQAQLHMPQSHMGYGDVGVHKPAWPPQPHLLPPLDAQKPLDVKQLKSEIKLEPTDAQKRPHPESEMLALQARQREYNVQISSTLGGDLDQPKIKIKTDIFKPDDLAHRQDKPLDVAQKSLDVSKPTDLQSKDDGHPIIGVENKLLDKPSDACKAEGAAEGGAGDTPRAAEPTTPSDKSGEDRKPFSSPELPKSGSTPGKAPTPGSEPKKRGRPKGSTNKPKASLPGGAGSPALAPPRPAPPRAAPPPARPRPAGYQYAIRPFRKDFSGIQFRRRWSDDCLDSSHIPNEVYFGDVPVSLEVLHNYYDANAERERLAAAAAHIAAQKAAAAKLAAAKLQARGLVTTSAEVTTVDSSSDDDSSGTSGSDSEESDDDTPLKRGPGRPKGSKNSPRAGGAPGAPPGGPPGGTPGRRGRPPVPPELRQPGITDMKKFCKAAGIRFDYKKLVEGCTKNKERVQKMLDLLIAAGLDGKPTLEKCQALKKAKIEKKEQEKQAKKEAKAKHKETDSPCAEGGPARRMTRGATGVKPRQRIVISSDEEDDTPAARRTLSKLRSSLNDDSDSD
ncbi:actin cytoskeleton-regulatory complex protein PAN1-like isoform X2 [Trichoplusia ni]|uniref:Actin cytoskeleton-regulatory complex protein PAN1-like isoform X2 n=1 Tax=Trichoplusia ni TaxID=7111 RepID=A0A7E5WJD6_TRINI|nr:actin cytoskeleton-regulatory complex protein PAN1-like isoform X2 [Trichoplusia ni]